MTAPNEVDRVLRGLSEAQRRVMRRPYGHSNHAFYPSREHRACHALAAMGLLRETSDNIGNPMFVFTTEGLAVRNLLKESASGQ